MHTLQIGCVVLAAGNAQRFGDNKLLASFQGKPLILRAFEAIPQELLSRVVVVTQYPQVEELAASFGFQSVRNRSPALGISHSVRLGTEALMETCGGILYQVADQPLLQKSSVVRLIETFCAHPDRIIVPMSSDRRGNPCLFPRDLFPELSQLRGDRGGSQVIRLHPERILPVELPSTELLDVDTVQALSHLQENC